MAGLRPASSATCAANGAPDPEDVLGEVFLQVARDISTFDGEETGFRSWVFTIAHHRLIDARRHTARRPVDLSAGAPGAGGARGRRGGGGPRPRSGVERGSAGARRSLRRPACGAAAARAGRT